MGANAFSRPQTQPDLIRMFSQVKGSPFDSASRQLGREGWRQVCYGHSEPALLAMGLVRRRVEFQDPGQRPRPVPGPAARADRSTPRDHGQPDADELGRLPALAT